MRIRIAFLMAIAATAIDPGSAQDRRVTPAGGGRRVALIIGNDKYSWKPLVNPVNDARAMARLLPSLGFDARDVTLATNTTLRQLQRVAREFLEKLRPDDVALMYYSGHGVEVRGENYLIPVDFPANASELEVQDDAYSAQQLLRNLEATPARVRLVILDACRDNPLRATRSASGGLARMEGRGTLVVFATGAGRTADDNRLGANGLFTSYLLKALPAPGLSIDQVVKQVAREVDRESKGRQTPAVYGLLLEDFVLVAGRGGGSVPDPPVNVKPASPPSDGVRVNPKDGLKYVWIPPGRFMMGCSLVGDYGCRNDEKPVHQVTISKGFWMGQTEVTQEAYQRVIGTNPSTFKGARRPVENVTWNDAQAFCNAVGMRQPTEAEWEYAALAGSTWVQDASLGTITLHGGPENGEPTDEVGQKQANAFGLYDTLRNVWEWVADWYGGYSAGAASDPQGPSSGQFRVLRGGGRLAVRNRGGPGYSTNNIGLRCAGELDP